MQLFNVVNLKFSNQKFRGKAEMNMKKYCYLIFIVTLSVFFMNMSAFAQDSNDTMPVSSDIYISDSTVLPGTNQDATILIAQNTQPADEDSDEDFLDDFDNTQQAVYVADPLYYFNYVMYTFNDILYFAALKPLATGYKFITPTFFRTGVKNVFHNLMFPVRFVNNLLQFKIKEAGTEVGIFLINSTAGVAGLVQVAQSEFDMNTSDEDLGQTLGSWSMGNGFYLVLPVLGPSSLRDAIGRVGDYFITPINHPNTDFFDYGKPWKLYYGLMAFDGLNATSFRLGDYEALKKASLDPYTALKDAYIQNRAEKIRQ